MSFASLVRKPFRYRYLNVSLYLIAVNVLVFAAGLAAPRLTLALALSPLAVASGWVWQVVTYMFTHANFTHLLVNMLGIFFFGTQVERRLGSMEFLLYYLVSGTLAGIASVIIYMATGAWYTLLLGASGAVFALLLAFAVLFPQAIVYLYGFIPLRAPVMVIGYTALGLGLQLFGARSNIAHLTHLAGFVVGLAYFPVRQGMNPFKRLLSK